MTGSRTQLPNSPWGITHVGQIQRILRALQNQSRRFDGVGGIGQSAKCERARITLHRAEQGSHQQREVLRRLLAGAVVVQTERAIGEGHDVDLGSLDQIRQTAWISQIGGG